MSANMTRYLYRPSVWILVISALLLALFFVWYRGGQTPLSPQEQQHYLGRVQQLPSAVREFVDVESIRAFMQTDDGKPFYVVNLFQLNEQAEYPQAQNPPTPGLQAFNRFSRLMLPIWIQHGAHPVFVSQINAAFFNDWDLVSVVRYRSRRDFMNIQTSEDYAQILPHRFAATRANIRLKLPGIAIPSPVFMVPVLFLCSSFVVITFHRRRK